MPYRSSDIFNCKNCGQCCIGYGGTYVTEQDIRAIADYINEPAERFVHSYCRPSGGKPLLAQKPDGYCIFWDQNCSIHPVKPRMCKAWPFIESVLTDVENWQIMAAFCSGMKTGLSKDRIRACVKKELKRLPPERASRKIPNNKYDEFVKSRELTFFVIPAKAGTQ